MKKLLAISMFAYALFLTHVCFASQNDGVVSLSTSDQRVQKEFVEVLQRALSENALVEKIKNTPEASRLYGFEVIYRKNIDEKNVKQSLQEWNAKNTVFEVFADGKGLKSFVVFNKKTLKEVAFSSKPDKASMSVQVSSAPIKVFFQKK